MEREKKFVVDGNSDKWLNTLSAQKVHYRKECQMNKFQRSWILLKSSLSVIARNKELLVFPMVTFLCTMAIIVFFLLPPVLRPTGHPYSSPEHWQAIWHSLFTQTPSATGQGAEQLGFTPGALIYLGFLYLLTMFIGTFCNVAFYHEIMAALGGEVVSIGRGLKFACSRLGSILMWTLFAGLVGLIIKVIEERLQLVGRIIGRLIGLAWSVAAVFVIPVIVREEGNVNPIAALQKSAGVLKQTWGEALIGYAGLAVANTMVILGSLVWLIGAGMVSAASHNYLVIAAAAVVWLCGILTWSYLAGVASNVFRGALYLYAAEGTVHAPYTQEMLDMAWKYRKS
jgi:hypothetical protein